MSLFFVFQLLGFFSILFLHEGYGGDFSFFFIIFVIFMLRFLLSSLG